MDAEQFEKLVPNIPENSIIMDNAPYHSVVLDKAPTSNTQKSIKQQWLTDKGIEWDPTMLKPELYDLVKQAKPLYIKYKIDTWAAEMGHRVTRLPPYHCELNPIELIWPKSKDMLQCIIHHLRSQNWIPSVKRQWLMFLLRIGSKPVDML